MTRELLQQAIDALERIVDEVEEKWCDTSTQKAAIKAIRAELAKPEHPAPAWHDTPTCEGLWLCGEGDSNPYRPERKPMTEVELMDGYCKTKQFQQFVQAFFAGARFAESFHGIKK